VISWFLNLFFHKRVSFVPLHHEARRLVFNDDPSSASTNLRAVVVYGGADAKVGAVQVESSR
jgi:hypothetical protein